MKNVRKIVFMGLLIAIEVVLTRFLSIQTPIVRIGFAFLPIAVSAMMFGPQFAGMTAAIADLVGMMIFPSGGAYFPGFTLTAFLTGAIFGLFLYKKPKTLFRISMSVIAVSIFINLGLDTLWIWLLTGKGIMIILPARILKCLVMIPIQITMIQIIWRHVLKHMNMYYLRVIED